SVLGELLVVLRRRDDRRQLGFAFLGLADLDHRHPIRFLVQLAQILDVLRVIDEEIIVADVVAELLLRTGDLGERRPRGLRKRRGGAGRDDDREDRHADAVWSDHRNLMKNGWTAKSYRGWGDPAHM